MPPVPIWQEETFVRGFETDFDNRWKPACFFQNMQQTATNHASNLGFDFPSLLEQGMVWVLSRLKVYFYHYPTVHDPVIIRTWPKGLQQKIFFTRDFQFSAPDGQLYAAATSAWLLIDPVKRRMLLPAALPGALPRNEGVSAVDELLEKLEPLDSVSERLSVRANYSAIDLMNHVNNARYIEWICDCFPAEHYRQHRLTWIQIHYNNEVRPGETVSLAAAPRPEDASRWMVTGSLNGGEVKAFEAELGWQKRA